MQRAQAERADVDDGQPLLEVTIEPEWRTCLFVHAPRDEKGDGRLTQASSRELEKPLRRGIEPLDVVDGDEQRIDRARAGAARRPPLRRSHPVEAACQWLLHAEGLRRARVAGVPATLPQRHRTPRRAGRGAQRTKVSSRLRWGCRRAPGNLARAPTRFPFSRASSCRFPPRLRAGAHAGRPPLGTRRSARAPRCARRCPFAPHRIMRRGGRDRKLRSEDRRERAHARMIAPNGSQRKKARARARGRRAASRARLAAALAAEAEGQASASSRSWRRTKSIR